MERNQGAALDNIIAWEGAEINISPDEPGGISKYGVSLRTYAEYMKKVGKPAPTFDDIKNLTEAQARDFYATVFLPPIRFNDLPDGVDVRLSDITVNLGITGGIYTLQLALQIFPLADTISDKAIATIGTINPSAVIYGLSAAWITNKHSTAGWTKYGKGWSARNTSVTNLSLAVALQTK